MPQRQNIGGGSMNITDISTKSRVAVRVLRQGVDPRSAGASNCAVFCNPVSCDQV